MLWLGDVFLKFLQWCTLCVQSMAVMWVHTGSEPSSAYNSTRNRFVAYMALLLTKTTKAHTSVRLLLQYQAISFRHDL